LLLLLVGCGSDDGSASADKGGSRSTKPPTEPSGEPSGEAPVAHDPPTRFESGGSLEVNPARLDSVTLDGTRAYTYDPEGGALVVVDLASSPTEEYAGRAEPEGTLPEGYLPAQRARANTAVPPSCERRGPALSTVEGTRLALALFPVVEAGSGTTPDNQALELVALDTAAGEAAWHARFDLDEDKVTCHIAGVSGNTAVVVLGGDREFGVAQTTYGIDLVTRKVVWRQENFDAQLVLGGHVVGGTADENGWVVLTSHDARSGRRQWTSSVQADWQLEASVWSPGRLFVRSTGAGGSDTAVVKLADGGVQDMAGFGERLVDVDRCVYDEQSRTFCTASTTEGAELTAYDADSGRRLWRVGGPSDTSGRLVPSLTAAYHGAVYGTVRRGDQEPPEPLVLDGATGKDREVSPGAAPWRVNGYVGLVPAGDHSVAVYLAVG
jgi:hypothetical protein